MTARSQHGIPVESWRLPPRTSQAERGNPVGFPLGQCAVRQTHDSAGLGCRKKRMPGCNSLDTGLNVTRRESGPTSDGSFIARELGASSA